MTDHDDLQITRGRVAVIEMRRPPENFIDVPLAGRIVEALRTLDAEGEARAVVLCSEGKHFCAGVDFSTRDTKGQAPGPHLYDVVIELFRQPLPVIAAVQGAAIGGGLGLALSADFRVASPEARFSANFARLGFHHGFALTLTLPALVGQQHALRMLYTGERVNGEDGFRMGICDRLVPADQLRDAAMELAEEIATSAPLAVRSIRTTMRRALREQAEAAMANERAEQSRLQQTDDWREGTAATRERRTPSFTGR